MALPSYFQSVAAFFKILDLDVVFGYSHVDAPDPLLHLVRLLARPLLLPLIVLLELAYALGEIALALAPAVHPPVNGEEHDRKHATSARKGFFDRVREFFKGDTPPEKT